MQFNIPNALTVLRICMIPVLVVVFYLPFQNHLLVAAVIFSGSYFYFQKKADVLGNHIMALEGQITRMNVGRPGDLDREKFDQQFGFVKFVVV